MHTPFEFQDEGSRIVYVKAVEVSDLPDAVRQQVGDVEQLYAVHDAAGQQLALVADRKLAFVLARQHDYEPVTVH
ncbi:Protein of unknown function [Cribrihabitans marinus]|uniref:DUF1150 family protein n=1 Tax=Cribrihabitans marinus TaxID=1227549 RepID=A0A1H7AKK6_9RHOB|nr:DUF1150 family protein [Cribrihabitans marinus]GGH31786.1 hypothetical protein GCM10010973_22830 [Cribrihabitans marinus]SEJ65114.1 Protein of unknown function [Cribrihabitans marinus]